VLYGLVTVCVPSARLVTVVEAPEADVVFTEVLPLLPPVVTRTDEPSSKVVVVRVPPPGALTVVVTGSGMRFSLEAEVGFVGKAGLAVESGAGFVVALDTEVSPELALEGQARDLVREIQDMRKEADLHIADRIRLSIQGAESILAVHAAYISSETLCVELVPKLGTPKVEREITLEGTQVQIGLEKL
jgi:hypothetical protein